MGGAQAAPAAAAANLLFGRHTPFFFIHIYYYYFTPSIYPYFVHESNTLHHSNIFFSFSPPIPPGLHPRTSLVLADGTVKRVEQLIPGLHFLRTQAGESVPIQSRSTGTAATVTFTLTRRRALAEAAAVAASASVMTRPTLLEDQLVLHVNHIVVATSRATTKPHVVHIPARNAYVCISFPLKAGYVDRHGLQTTFFFYTAVEDDDALEARRNARDLCRTHRADVLPGQHMLLLSAEQLRFCTLYSEAVLFLCRISADIPVPGAVNSAETALTSLIEEHVVLADPEAARATYVDICYLLGWGFFF